MTQPAIFLDRDGVLNRAVIHEGRPYPPQRIEDLEVIPGVPEALARLKAAGFALVVVTNQPDVARGLQSEAGVRAIHEGLKRVLPLDEIRVCPHDDADACACRKPKPGLLTQAPLYDLPRSVMVGDRWRDIEAGRHAGCGAVILIDYGYDEPQHAEPDMRFSSLAEATNWILSQMVNV
jgi:D-glycero-D-manno-heptose 1,7-bisphosphate phosphatase